MNVSNFRPKYITFDCYGTLTRFQMADLTRVFYGEIVGAENIEQFIDDFAAYRFDEVLGAWKPYSEVICNAVERTCKRWNIPFKEEDGLRYYNAVPTWGPHPDVPEPLKKIADHIPLVILSNASNDQIQSNVDLLEAPFHAVYTAEQAQSYKPRLQGFEYMLDNLGCGPEDILHVSSSLRYDLMSAHDLRVGGMVFVNRGHGPSSPYYDYHEVKDIGGLPEIVGL